MTPEAHPCPICGDVLLPVAAGLNRTDFNVFLTGFGSSVLQIQHQGKWTTYLTPSFVTSGLFCTRCGSPTLAPALPEMRAELGLDR